MKRTVAALLLLFAVVTAFDDDYILDADMSAKLRGAAKSTNELTIVVNSALNNTIYVKLQPKDEELPKEILFKGTEEDMPMVVVIRHKTVSIYSGCKRLHSYEDSDLLKSLAAHELELYYERDAQVTFYKNKKSAMLALKCIDENGHRQRLRRDGDHERHNDDYLNNFIASNKAIINRGDIPSMGIETCDDEVIRQIQLLRRTIELLRAEIGDQKHTIESLRAQLQECCHRQIERCTGSSCYPGY